MSESQQASNGENPSPENADPTDVPANGDGVPDSKWKTWPAVRWWFNRRANADLARRRDFWRNRDGVRNKASKPSSEESCELVSVWVAEVFTPSTLSGLTDGLRRRGWDYTGAGNRDIVDWVFQSRVSGGGSWSRLGLVRHRGEGLSDLHDDLPPGVDAINLGLFALTSSITVMTAAFILSEEAAVGYHETLAADYETALLPLQRDRGRRLAQLGWRIRYGPGWMWRRGHSIEDPEVKRRGAARRYLAGHRERAQEWVAERFPGVFAAGLLGGDYPTAALNVLEAAEPFVEDGPGWQRAAGLDNWWRTWRSEDWPGCVLAIPGGGLGELPHLMRFAVKRSHTEEWRLDRPGNWNVSFAADDFLAGLLARWAILTASYGQREALATLRDVTAGKTEHRVVRELKSLRQRATSSALDAELFAREGVQLANDKDLLRHSAVEFKREDSSHAEGVEFLDLLSQNLLSHSEDLGRLNRLVLDTTALTANLTAAISSIRLQRVVIIVSIVSLAIATIALVVAASSTGG